MKSVNHDTGKGLQCHPCLGMKVVAHAVEVEMRQTGMGMDHWGSNCSERRRVLALRPSLGLVADHVAAAGTAELVLRLDNSIALDCQQVVVE